MQKSKNPFFYSDKTTYILFNIIDRLQFLINNEILTQNNTRLFLLKNVYIYNIYFKTYYYNKFTYITIYNYIKLYEITIISVIICSRRARIILKF